MRAWTSEALDGFLKRTTDLLSRVGAGAGLPPEPAEYRVVLGEAQALALETKRVLSVFAMCVEFSTVAKDHAFWELQRLRASGIDFTPAGDPKAASERYSTLYNAIRGTLEQYGARSYQDEQIKKLTRELKIQEDRVVSLTDRNVALEKQARDQPEKILLRLTDLQERVESQSQRIGRLQARVRSLKQAARLEKALKVIRDVLLEDEGES